MTFKVYGIEIELDGLRDEVMSALDELVGRYGRRTLHDSMREAFSMPVKTQAKVAPSADPQAASHSEGDPLVSIRDFSAVLTRGLKQAEQVLVAMAILLYDYAISEVRPSRVKGLFLEVGRTPPTNIPHVLSRLVQSGAVERLRNGGRVLYKITQQGEAMVKQITGQVK